MSAVRVFLLDDHEVVRRGLKDLFDSEDGFEVVGESGSAKDAEARIPALRPDVAVLDGRLPDGSGGDVCRSIRSVDPSIRAIILTSYDDDEALFAAILAGAAGYVLKQIGSGDLVDGVRRVEQRLAVGDLPDHVEEVVAHDLLEHIARRPGHDRGEQRLVVVVRGEDECLDVRSDGSDGSAHLDAGPVGESGIEHGDVGS